MRISSFINSQKHLQMSKIKTPPSTTYASKTGDQTLSFATFIHSGEEWWWYERNHGLKTQMVSLCRANWEVHLSTAFISGKMQPNTSHHSSILQTWKIIIYSYYSNVMCFWWMNVAFPDLFAVFPTHWFKCYALPSHWFKC